MTIIEIRAAEGGRDAELLVEDQIALYAKYCVRWGFSAEIVEHTDGYALLRVTGLTADTAFAHEAGVIGSSACRQLNDAVAYTHQRSQCGAT